MENRTGLLSSSVLYLGNYLLKKSQRTVGQKGKLISIKAVLKLRKQQFISWGYPNLHGKKISVIFIAFVRIHSWLLHDLSVETNLM